MNWHGKGLTSRCSIRHIDTSDATGRLLFNMLGAIAQFETEIRAERQMDGIQKAKERGVRFGPKKKLDSRADCGAPKRRRAKAILIKTLMHDYGVSKVSVYRYLGAAHAALATWTPHPHPLRRERHTPV